MQLKSIYRMQGIVSTDDIIPAKYKHMFTDPEQLAPHAFESFDPNFVNRTPKSDVIVSDSVFGIGSSREQAVTTLKANGIAFILAPNFGRIFFRNCWNLGLPALEIDTTGILTGDKIKINLEIGEVKTEDGKVFHFSAPPTQLLHVLHSGGLLKAIKRKGFNYGEI